MTSEPPAAPAPFHPLLVQQVRAHDTYGVWEGKDNDALLEPFIVDKAKRKTIPLVGDPDARTLARVRQFYAAVCLAVEQRTGIMAAPIFELSHEGFGRVVLTASRLIVLNRYLRDVHRFGFLSLDALEQEANRMIDEAVELIARFPEVARL
jgi:probable nitrogen fixation protein